jgi:hypothetical protein
LDEYVYHYDVTTTEGARREKERFALYLDFLPDAQREEFIVTWSYYVGDKTGVDPERVFELVFGKRLP